jgi:hypothetical protein
LEYRSRLKALSAFIDRLKGDAIPNAHSIYST